jgi:hypothetical protein
LEEELNGKLAPRYAKKNKLQSGMICAVHQTDAQDFPWVVLVPEREIQDKTKALGFYRGFREAKQALQDLAEKFRLCRKMLGIERGGGPCSGVSQNRCDGACQKPELRESRRGSMLEAFRRAGAVSWPYPGAVLIEERESDTAEQGEAYLVQNWILIARIRYTGDSHQVYKMSQSFDRDQFKVLKKIIQAGSSRVRLMEKKETELLLGEAVLG